MSYAKSDRIEVHAFTRQRDGEEVVIGRRDAAAFVSLPAEAVEILDSLAEGRSVGEAQAEFAQAHGVEPDLDDLLQHLERRGFVQVRGRSAVQPGSAPSAKGAPSPAVRYHFENIPEAVARRFFGPLPVTLALLTIAVALGIAWADPSLIPGRYSLVFTTHRTAKIVTLSLLAYGSIFLHELAHLLAARARGVKSRIGISNRLWFLVAETDMTGLWAVPSRQRYLPMLAGPLLDGFCAAILFLVLAAASRGAFRLGPTAHQLLAAMIFVYLFRLLWQCYLFVRTDFYFVITTYFGCKNLMADTQCFVRNLALRAVGSRKLTDQSHIPLRERRVIRFYSVLWFLGRVAAFASLFLITLPVLFRYLGGAWRALLRGYQGDRYELIDAVTVSVLNLAPLIVGLTLWITKMVRKRETR